MEEFQSIRVPYGQVSLEFTLPKDKIQAILAPKPYSSSLPEGNIISESLENPTNSPPLRELVKGKKHILLITNDNTRPFTSRMTFPLILKEIKAGNPQAKITILIATGLHSKPEYQELREKFTEDVLSDSNIDILVHDAYNDITFLSKLSTNTELWINKLILESDVVIAEGNIEPHFFAGFTGGGKSILPGISGYNTIFSNHSAERIDHPLAKNGVLEGNPIYTEICESAYKSKLSFIVNVVLGEGNQVVRAFSGDPFIAHKAGVDFIKRYTALPSSPAEIVLTSNGGYPLDRNVYQIVKGISVAAQTTKPKGVIIIAAECRDGVGHSTFYDLLSNASSPTELLEKIRSGDIYCKDQWQVQILAKILERNTVIVVSDKVDRYLIEKMHMLYASSILEAVSMASSIIGKESKIVIVPDGPKTIIGR